MLQPESIHLARRMFLAYQKEFTLHSYRIRNIHGKDKDPFTVLRCLGMCLQLASGPRISSIKLDRKGKRLLASCSDRVLRVAEVAAPSEQQRQQAFPAEQALARARILSRVRWLSLPPQACAHAASGK